MIEIKTILLGEKCVGKTQIINNLRSKQNNLIYTPTIGVDYYKHDSKNVSFNIWDTSGAPDFAHIVRTFFRGVHLVILVYRNEDDFNTIMHYKREVEASVYTKIRFAIFSIGKMHSFGQNFGQEFGHCFFKFNALNRRECLKTFSYLAEMLRNERRDVPTHVDLTRPPENCLDNRCF